MKNIKLEADADESEVKSLLNRVSNDWIFQIESEKSILLIAKKKQIIGTDNR
jgi:hypothetical protein